MNFQAKPRSGKARLTYSSALYPGLDHTLRTDLALRHPTTFFLPPGIPGGDSDFEFENSFSLVLQR